MKKPDLIRSDKPHAVQMSPGASVAQRKTSAKKSADLDVQESPENIQRAAPPVKSVKARPSAPPKAPEMELPLATAPSRRKAKPEVKKATRKPRLSKPKTVTSSPAPTEPVAAIVPLWEKDNPIKAQIQELQALNAQLSEQLQRLSISRPARGSMS
jgi:hypothetical protein